MPDLAVQLCLMALEAALVAVVLLLLFRVRGTFGLAPLYATVAVLYYFATEVAGTTYIRITPGLLASPGSAALFPASLFAVLFVYIREDANNARNMIYALLVSNVVAAGLGGIVAQHLESPLAVNLLHVPPALFLQQPRLFVVGTLALYADTVLIILVYETLWRMRASLFLRIYLSLAMVLTFDTLLFVTGSFVERRDYGVLLASGIVGKLAMAVIYAAALAVYLKRFDVLPAEGAGTAQPQHLGDLFQVLTYRQRYETLRAQATRDALTGVYNRGFFDEALPAQLAAARRAGRPLALLMLDVDHFKRINDRCGHVEGDRALRVVAQTLEAAVRETDKVCRYGGEEFFIILPRTPLASALPLAARVREAVPRACTAQGVCRDAGRVSVTIGVAASPQDGSDADTLVRAADRRLYRGKREGRDRVVAE